MNWYLKALRQFNDFGGRARRMEYWMFVLFYALFSILASALDQYFGFKTCDGRIGVLNLLYALAMLVPFFAVSVRRLHDIGKSGGWVFINLVPLIGSIWFFILMITRGQEGVNRYGQDPKGEASNK